MLNQLLKFTLVSSALFWLKPRWKGLLALVVFVMMVHILHGEYLGYVELSDNRSFLLWSYVVKWISLCIGVIAYFFLAVKGMSKPSSGHSSARLSRQRGAPDTGKAASTSDAEPDDGFNFLREKKQLDSEAEQLLQRKR